MRRRRLEGRDGGRGRVAAPAATGSPAAAATAVPVALQQQSPHTAASPPAHPLELEDDDAAAEAHRASTATQETHESEPPLSEVPEASLESESDDSADSETEDSDGSADTEEPETGADSQHASQHDESERDDSTGKSTSEGNRHLEQHHPQAHVASPAPPAEAPTAASQLQHQILLQPEPARASAAVATERAPRTAGAGALVGAGTATGTSVALPTAAPARAATTTGSIGPLSKGTRTPSGGGSVSNSTASRRGARIDDVCIDDVDFSLAASAAAPARSRSMHAASASHSVALAGARRPSDVVFSGIYDAAVAETASAALVAAGPSRGLRLWQHRTVELAAYRSPQLQGAAPAEAGRRAASTASGSSGAGGSASGGSATRMGSTAVAALRSPHAGAAATSLPVSARQDA